MPVPVPIRIDLYGLNTFVIFFRISTLTAIPPKIAPKIVPVTRCKKALTTS
jgi:hypothetical protein